MPTMPIAAAAMFIEELDASSQLRAADDYAPRHRPLFALSFIFDDMIRTPSSLFLPRPPHTLDYRRHAMLCKRRRWISRHYAESYYALF